MDIDGQPRRGFSPRRRQFFHRFVHRGLKILFAALLANTRWDIFDNLESLAPAEIHFYLLIEQLSLAKITVIHGPIFLFLVR